MTRICFVRGCSNPPDPDNDIYCFQHKMIELRKTIRRQKLMGKNICTRIGCSNKSTKRGSYCKLHNQKHGVCKFIGCRKARQDKNFCVAHGGKHKNVKCKAVGCPRFNSGGGYCRSHGGGKKCTFKGCNRVHRNKGVTFCDLHVKVIPFEELISNV